MPYIITVGVPGSASGRTLPVGRTYAVATLDEAREAAESEVDRSLDALGEEPEAHAYFAVVADAALSLPEDGGVIELPDGYVIDVRFVDWDEMFRLAQPSNQDLPRSAYADWELIDAYNA
jgi:hypothetical protein